MNTIIKFSVFILFCLNSISLLAQTEQEYHQYLSLQEQNMKLKNNQSYWTVSALGGMSLYQGEWDRGRKKVDLLTPYGKLNVARWFSSVWGLRLQLDGGVQKNSAVGMEGAGSSDKFYFVDSYLEAITDVMNWGRTKRLDRPVSVYLYIGAGGAWTPARTAKKAQLSPAAVLGGQINFRLDDFWSIALEVDGTIVKDNFNSHLGGRLYEGYMGASVGLVYRFKNKRNEN